MGYLRHEEVAAAESATSGWAAGREGGSRPRPRGLVQCPDRSRGHMNRALVELWAIMVVLNKG
jgi:hypothetical protein